MKPRSLFVYAADPLRVSVIVAASVFFAIHQQVTAQTLYASGQLLIENGPGTADDVRENYLYAIDPFTGVATPISPVNPSPALPSGLAGTPDGRLFGFNGSGQVVEISIPTALSTPLTSPSSTRSTGFDILAAGRGYLIPLVGGQTQRLARLDLATGAATALGGASEIGNAVDAARGTPAGTAAPFVISLGSVGDILFGVDLDSSSLIQLNPDSGMAAVVGSVGSVQSGFRSAYSGFAALSGVDLDGDGAFDQLYGNANFFDDDNNPVTPSVRFGGLVRYDLTSGTWDLIGSNPGVIFFGFGASPVPEPGAVALLAVGCGALLVSARSRRRFRQLFQR